MNQGIKAVVEKVVPAGPHGPFAIATTKAEGLSGSVTFSLERNVWQEKENPQPGEIVFLYELVEKRQGWRAKKGRHWKPSDEQTAEKERTMKKIMKKLRVFVERIRSKYFPTEEDRIWKQWVDYGQKNTGDLINLLSLDVKDGFKKRALFLLLVPSADFSPVYWIKELGRPFPGAGFLKILPPNLLDYAVDLIVEFYTVLGPQHNEIPKSITEKCKNLAIHMTIQDKYHEALHFYNYCILDLLTLLPLEKGERIFPLFSLNDVSALRSTEDYSGYYPFRALLHARDINEKFKKAADAAMRKIVQDELSGKTKPRSEWENALYCYSDIIQAQAYSEFTYSKDLFAEQIKFIMDNRRAYAYHLIKGWDVIKIFNLLSDDAYKELRHQIARYSVLEGDNDSSGFQVFEENTVQAAEWILKEFEGSDTELADRIKELIKQAEERQAKDAAQKATTNNSEESLLAQMK